MQEDNEKDEEEKIEKEDEEVEDAEDEEDYEIAFEERESVYPDELLNDALESEYIGMLLANPKVISMYYFTYDECAFNQDILLNIYKSVLFTEGQAYAPERAKQHFNFARDTYESNQLKYKLTEKFQDVDVNYEKVYTELKKDLPKIGMIADTPMGMGKVVSVDVFKRTYSVDLKDKGIVEFLNSPAYPFL